MRARFGDRLKFAGKEQKTHVRQGLFIGHAGWLIITI